MNSQTLNIAIGVSVSIAALFVGYLGYLVYRNRHPPLQTARVRPLWQRRALIFVEFFLLELIGVLFTVFAVLDLESYRAELQSGRTRGAFQRDSLDSIRIAFYILVPLKYAIVALTLYIHFRDRSLPLRVSQKCNGYLRADWVSVLEGLVFIPVIVIEGMLVNTELFLSGGRDVGDIFPFDSIILLTLDAFLYIKLKIAVSRNIHSTEDGGWVDVAAMAWAIALIVYELLLCVLFILFHLETIDRTAMQLTRELRIVIVALILHPLVSSFTSLMAQSITANIRALKSAPRALVAQLLSYVRYFHRTPQAIVINVVMYGLAYYLYIWPFVVTSLPRENVRDEPTLRIGILTVAILFNVLNLFLLINLVYGSLKRLGPFIGLKPPFDGSTYASAINQALSECQANFRLDSHLNEVPK